jgi:hypothetical protein
MGARPIVGSLASEVHIDVRFFRKEQVVGAHPTVGS